MKYFPVLLMTAIPWGNPLIKSMAPDSWISIPDTKMTAVCPEPDKYPDIQGVIGCAAVTKAWGGAALDESGKRLLLFGGGHADYHGNEIYAFDLELLKWSRLTEPSPSLTLSTDPMADGQPAPRHTYDGLAWISHAYRLFAYGGSMAGNGWGTEVTWTFGSSWKNMAPAGGYRPTTNCCNFSSAYDPATRLVFMRDPNYLYSYSYDLNTWDRLLDWPHSWGPGKSVVDTKRGILFTAGSGEFMAYDISSGKDITTSWITTGGDVFLAGYGVGMAYDSKRDQLVGYIGGSPWILDMTSKVWSRGSSDGAPIEQEEWGTYGRWQYLAWEDAFALVNQAGQDVYFYKPSKTDTIPAAINTNADTASPKTPKNKRVSFCRLDGRLFR